MSSRLDVDDIDFHLICVLLIFYLLLFLDVISHLYLHSHCAGSQTVKNSISGDLLNTAQLPKARYTISICRWIHTCTARLFEDQVKHKDTSMGHIIRYYIFLNLLRSVQCTYENTLLLRCLRSATICCFRRKFLHSPR